MIRKPKIKIYAYVDETGQETVGGFFLVAAVIIIAGRDQLRKDLTNIERQSGRGSRKWTHSPDRQRQKYIDLRTP